MLGIIHGRLTRDPEIRTGTGNNGDEWVVANFTVASANHYGAKTESSFYNCSIWGAKARAIEKFFSKGSEIVVTGYLEQEEYNKNGESKRVWKFAATEFDFCGSKADKPSNGAPEGFSEVNDEDVPF